MARTLPIYQVDAFTDRLFTGNPAAVCPLEAWPDDATMQAIARENNLSETAFFVPEGEGWRLRWFTPAVEVELCGHATLASAWVIVNLLAPDTERVRFYTLSGELTVRRNGPRLALDFPSCPPQPCAARPDLAQALGREPREVLRSADYLAVFESEEEVRALTPDMGLLRSLDARGLITTAPGRGVDFVSRFFAPQVGVDEDPVTGSAHCTLTPYWSRRLGKKHLQAEQVSQRGGRLWCEDRGDRIVIEGHAVLYMQGHIAV